MASSDILHVQKEAISILKKAISYLKEQVIYDDKTKKSGWTQFLDESQLIPPPQPGITGTAYGILALITGGEQPKSRLVKKALETLKSLQRVDGGWSTTPLQLTASLTRPTCISLNALILAKESHHSRELRRAATWLVKARNKDGAWGAFYQDQRSDTVSTALVIEAFSSIKDPKYLEVTAKGVEWLVDNARNGAWGRTPEEKPQIVHTAHVVKALSRCDGSKAFLNDSISWMIQRFNTVKKSRQQDIRNEIQVHHDVRYPDPNNPDGAKFTWTHLPKQRLMAALLDWTIDLESHEVISIAKEIIKTQEPEGFWRTELFEQVPIWLFAENCRVLRKLIDRVYEQYNFIKLKHELEALKREFKHTSNKQQYEIHIKQLDARLFKLEGRGIIRSVVKVLRSICGMLLRGATFIYSKPVIRISSCFILIVLIAGVPIYFIVSLTFSSQVTVQTVTSLLSVIVGVISLWYFIKRRR